MMCSQIPGIRNLKSALKAQPLNLVKNGAMVQRVPCPLSRQGSLADSSLNSSPGKGERLGSGGGGNLTGTEEDEGMAFVQGGDGIGEKREVWLRARWTEERGGRQRRRETIEVSE